MAHYTRKDILELPDLFRKNFVNSLPGLKPAMVVGTLDTQGRTNLSIVSQVIHVGARPPLMGVLFRPGTVPRHTVENLLAIGYFTLNQVATSWIDKAHQTSARYEAGMSEFEAVGLTPWYSTGCPAPYVAEAQVRIGLRPVERHRLSANQTDFIIGSVEEVFFPENALSEDGFLDPEKLGTAAVGGLDSYYSAKKIARFSYAKPDRDLSLLDDPA